MSRRNSLVGRRGSLRSGSIQHDQAVLFSPIKVEVKTVDMDPEQQRIVEGFTVDAFEKSSSERAVAAAIRQAMDEKYSKYWNVVVGRHFGSDVTHLTKQYIQMQYGPLNILVWKAS